MAYNLILGILIASQVAQGFALLRLMRQGG